MPLHQKIIAFDLDGTLTESKQALSQEMYYLLSKLASEKKVVVISGGSISQFKKQFLPAFYEDTLETSLVIKSNLILLPISGSERYEFNEQSRDWELTEREPFPEEIKKRVIVALQKIIDSGQYEIPSPPYGEYIEDRVSQVTLSAWGQLAPLEKKLQWDPDQKKRLKIQAVLEQQFPDVMVGIGGTTSIDILPKGFTKAVGLMRLLEKLGLKRGDMIFVGDAIFPGGNDYAVLEAGIETVKVKDTQETASYIRTWTE